MARPGGARKLLIYDSNVGYGGHPSAKYANEAFIRMGEKTGAYQAIVSRDPSIFRPEQLRQFDAVFFNNTVGNLFTEPVLRQSLIDFVYGGGGLMGVHGTSVAFTQWPGAIEDWPEFGILLGARGANHRTNKEHVFIKLDDARHPLNQVFAGQGFDYRDEFFRVHDPYSRHRLRVLFSIDTEKTDMRQGPAYGNLVRADNDYALAWIRNYGRGRVFYCTIAHNPYVFWDARMLQFYLGAIQFVVGDLPCPTLPSALLTPPIRAQEQLGWRFGAELRGNLSLFESIEVASRLGLPYLGVTWKQTVSREMDKPLDDQLGEAELRQIRLKLDSAGVRLLSCDISNLPSNPAALRHLFGFLKKIGIEVVSGSPTGRDLDAIEPLCDEYKIQLALRSRDLKSSQPAWTPREVLRQCQNRSPRIGAAGEVESWKQAKINPVDALRLLGDRLITLHFSPTLASPGAGSGMEKSEDSRKLEQVLRELRQLNIKPAMLSMTFAAAGTNAPAAVPSAINQFNELSLKMVPESGSIQPLGSNPSSQSR